MCTQTATQLFVIDIECKWQLLFLSCNHKERWSEIQELNQSKDDIKFFGEEVSPKPCGHHKPTLKIYLVPSKMLSMLIKPTTILTHCLNCVVGVLGVPSPVMEIFATEKNLHSSYGGHELPPPRKKPAAPIKATLGERGPKKLTVWRIVLRSSWSSLGPASCGRSKGGPRTLPSASAKEHMMLLAGDATVIVAISRRSFLSSTLNATTATKKRVC